jgi:hypothetical protein
MSLNQIIYGSWGFIEDLVRAFDAAMETDKNRYGGTYLIRTSPTSKIIPGTSRTGP